MARREKGSGSWDTVTKNDITYYRYRKKYDGKEVSDGNTNMDKTIEYEYQIKMGVATIIGKRFGVWTLK